MKNLRTRSFLAEISLCCSFFVVGYLRIPVDIDQNHNRLEKAEMSSEDLRNEIASMNVRLEVLIQEVKNVGRQLEARP